MAQQTAVEWFAKEINNMNVSREATLFINKLKDQAKQMEKKQIEEICLSVIEQILDNLEKGEEVESETIFKKHLERFK